VRLVRRLPPGALVCGCDLRQRVLQGHGELCRQGRRAVRVVSAPVLARYGWPWYKDHYDKAFGTGDCARSGTSSGGSRRACQRASFDCGRSDGCRPFGRRNAPRGRGWLGTSSSRRLRPRRGDRGGRQTSRRMRVRYTRRAFASARLSPTISVNEARNGRTPFNVPSFGQFERSKPIRSLEGSRTLAAFAS
jgi:hypothetical protein